jgi:DNA-binding transcriptional LysR family regulator
MPHVRAIIRQSHSSELIQAVLDGALDFAIITYDGELLEPDIVKESIGENRVVVAARGDHPLAGRGPLTPMDVASQPWIVPPRHDLFRNKLETLFTRHGLDRPIIRAESSGVLFTLSYIRAHDALAYIPHRVMLLSGGDGLTALSVPDFEWRPQSLLISRRGSSLSPAVRAHIKFLKEACCARESALAVRASMGSNVAL